MTFTPRNGTLFRTIAEFKPLVRAWKKLGKPIVFVPVRHGVHAGDIQRARLARRVPGALTVVALIDAPTDRLQALTAEHVDCILEVSAHDLLPHGLRTCVVGAGEAARTGEAAWPGEAAGELARELTLLLGLFHIVQPNDVFLSEKDYEFLIAAQRMITDFHMDIRVKGVPIVREPDGLACALGNAQLSPSGRDVALAISAALVAGAHASGKGQQAVLQAVQAVLSAAPELSDVEVQLVGVGLGEPPVSGDARLCISTTVDSVLLTDNAPVSLGLESQDTGTRGC